MILLKLTLRAYQEKQTYTDSWKMYVGAICVGECYLIRGRACTIT